jgi:hypothetical protein
MKQKHVIVASALAALRFVFSLLGAALPGLLGFPGASGVINVLWAGGFSALPPLITRASWSSTISGVVYGILALPLPLSGPPGFLPKVVIGLSTGLAADLVFRFFVNRPTFHRLGSVLMGAAAQTVLGVELAIFGLLLSIPGIDKYVQLQFSLVGMVATVAGGGFSGLLGWYVYAALRDSGVVRRIQG